MPEITLSYQPRIVICIPVYGWVPGETLVSMASMLVNGFQSRLIIGIKVSSSSGLAPARNELVKQALDEGDTFYTQNFGLPALREALAAYSDRKSVV
mgnify:CR=1 FL=1